MGYLIRPHPIVMVCYSHMYTYVPTKYIHSTRCVLSPDFVMARRCKVADSEAGMTEIHTRGLIRPLSADLRAFSDL